MQEIKSLEGLFQTFQLTGYGKLSIIPINNVANLKVEPTAAEIITRNVVDNPQMSDMLGDKITKAETILHFASACF